ncbi:MAG: HpaII family restriction endonuclease [Cyanobacteria bacterium P01_G01_bin.19]
MKYSLKFIDLFAGIGGFHEALKKLSMECVFASEIDQNSRKTYLANHQIKLSNFNQDIRDIVASDIPDHDLLCAGFPCQPFSQAGYKKGFDDGDKSERGNLFFCIVDILEAKKPRAYIIENVRHLLKHDQGRTFKTICKYLKDAGYSVDYQILKASEYGIPQHRPRIFLVGFNQELVNTSEAFNFPAAIPLKMTMSDIWQGNCNRDIGFTLRVGGRRSPIDDRRNWDGYLVDGEVVRIMPKQGIKMMGFPDRFRFPVSNTEAMKQLGNSVCVDVVYYVAKQVNEYLKKNSIQRQIEAKQLKSKFNKGEWSEFYAFLRLLLDEYLSFGDPEGNPIDDYVAVFNLKHNNTDIEYFKSERKIEVRDVHNRTIKEIALSELISKLDITKIYEAINNSTGSSFALPEVQKYLELLNIDSFKGSSYSKGDLNISFNRSETQYLSQDIGVKSDIGKKPTLLNSSSATNFIFRINNFTTDIDTINNIKTRKSKIRDRILRLRELNSTLKFVRCEKEIHSNNLKKVDSLMPDILASILLKYYSGEGSKISDLVTDENEICRVKDYLKSILLGMFSSKKWDGNYTANGSILIRKQGDLVLYHVIKDNILKDYLFYNTKLDTPSSTRHRFGNIYKEDNQIFIKLNLQIRFF